LKIVVKLKYSNLTMKLQSEQQQLSGTLTALQSNVG